MICARLRKGFDGRDYERHSPGPLGLLIFSVLAGTAAVMRNKTAIELQRRKDGAARGAASTTRATPVLESELRQKHKLPHILCSRDVAKCARSNLCVHVRILNDI